jgi:enterochelin esterase-like enzyme
MGPTRRGLLLGAAAGLVAGCGESSPGTSSSPERIVTGSFTSRARGGKKTAWAIATPSGSARRLPVLVVLHGLGNDHVTAMGRLGLDDVQDDLSRHGLPPFAIASVDGGTTYWHRRPWGEDAGAMVLHEFLPLLADRGLRTDRIGLLGWSMGGYGALRLAGILGSRRCAVVAAESPALWLPGSEASRSGFEDAAEYARFSVMDDQRDLAGIPVRIDCGTSDPYYAATHAYVAGFPADHRPVAHFARGGHEMSYWRRTAPAQLRFVGAHLA